jgi:hypothetical protein
MLRDRENNSGDCQKQQSDQQELGGVEKITREREREQVSDKQNLESDS